jgi:hypothetical protein
MALACATLVGSFCHANAAAVRFDFSSRVSGNSFFVEGAGAPFHISIFADNGSSSLLNQIWLIQDYLSASVQIGLYTATLDQPLTAFDARTDALGQVTGIFLLDQSDGNTDSFGSTNIRLLATENVPLQHTFQALFAGTGPLVFADTIDPLFANNWTVSLVSPVAATPLPAALPLFGTGLGFMGLVGWSRKRRSEAVV